jgi:predicted phage tail protein
MRLILHGTLAALTGQSTWDVNCSSVLDAIRFIQANYQTFTSWLCSNSVVIRVNDRIIQPTELVDQFSPGTIEVLPVVHGAQDAGGSISGGQILSAVTVDMFSQLQSVVPDSGIRNALASGNTSQLLSPIPYIGTPSLGNYDSTTTGLALNRPELQTGEGGEKTYNFSGISNSSQPGTSVPIIYGQPIVGSIVISLGTSVDTR